MDVGSCLGLVPLTADPLAAALPIRTALGTRLERRDVFVHFNLRPLTWARH